MSLDETNFQSVDKWVSLSSLEGIKRKDWWSTKEKEWGAGLQTAFGLELRHALPILRRYELANSKFILFP